MRKGGGGAKERGGRGENSGRGDEEGWGEQVHGREGKRDRADKQRERRGDIGVEGGEERGICEGRKRGVKVGTAEKMS